MQSTGVESTLPACDPDQCSPLAALHTRGYQRALAELAVGVMWLDDARRDPHGSLIAARAAVEQLARRRRRVRVWCYTAQDLHAFGCPLRAALFAFERALANYAIEHEACIEAAAALQAPP
jgi:hypothetical protein